MTNIFLIPIKYKNVRKHNHHSMNMHVMLALTELVYLIVIKKPIAVGFNIFATIFSLVSNQNKFLNQIIVL